MGIPADLRSVLYLGIPALAVAEGSRALQGATNELERLNIYFIILGHYNSAALPQWAASCGVDLS